jgi:hypothetical protein
MAIDHHLLDLLVGEEFLEGPEPDRVAEDEADDLVAARLREDRGGTVDQLADGIRQWRGLGTGRGLGPSALDQPQPQLGGERTCVFIVAGDASQEARRDEFSPPLSRGD